MSYELITVFMLIHVVVHSVVHLNPLIPCCHMGTTIKHPVPDRVKTSFVIFDIRALWRSSSMSVRVPGCQKLN